MPENSFTALSQTRDSEGKQYQIEQQNTLRYSGGKEKKKVK